MTNGRFHVVCTFPRMSLLGVAGEAIERPASKRVVYFAARVEAERFAAEVRGQRDPRVAPCAHGIKGHGKAVVIDTQAKASPFASLSLSTGGR
jgi:hypothetical protein